MDQVGRLIEFLGSRREKMNKKEKMKKKRGEKERGRQERFYSSEV